MIFQEKILDKDLDDIANKIKSLGLGQPLEFLIESHHPLSNLMNHLLLLAEPIMMPFLSTSRLGAFLSILSQERSREHFLSILRED